MKTKTKPAPTRRKSAPAADSSARVSPPTYRVHVHPAKAEFFKGDDAEPSSRIPNGSDGSEAAARVAAGIAQLRDDGETVSVVHFDAQGREIAFHS